MDATLQIWRKSYLLRFIIISLSIRIISMYYKTWESLVLVGMMIFEIERSMQQLQDAEMVSDILDHPV